MGWMGKKGEGINKYKLPVMKNSHRNVKNSIGNIDSNIVITICGVRWVLGLLG